ncbi:MAG: LamG domain-containing protein [Nitrospinota bacterium]|nr:LamG domain-containing protein [Nitrospinota bacterium]
MSLSLLLHLDGTHGDTTTTDSSPSAHTISLANGAALSNVQAKFGPTSAYLDGVDDYLLAENALSDWSFVASEAFTFDQWIYLPAIPGVDSPIISVEPSPFLRWTLEVKSTGALGFRVYNGSPTPAVNISGGSISTATWTHIALVRQTSGAIDLYINGVSVASATYSAAILTTGTSAAKYGWAFFPSPLFLNMYIDEAHILKGEAAWTANFTPPTAPYAPIYDVDGEHGSPIIAIIEAEHGSPIFIGLHAEHGSPFGAIIEAEQGSPFGAWVEAEHGSPILWLIEGGHGSRYSLLALVDAEHGSSFNLRAFNLAEADHGSLFSAFVETDHGSFFSLLALTDSEHGSLYSTTIPVDAEHGSPFILLAYDLVETEHGSLFRLGLAESFDVTDAAILYHQGRRVEILSARIKQDEGDPFWSGSMELASAADYAAMQLDDPLELHLGAVVYALMVDGKEKTRSFGQVSLSITAISPGAALAFPRAMPITKSWPAVMARAAAEEALGQPIDWAITNWLIPDSRLAVLAAGPLEVARKIIEAAGGVLQSNPDGSFAARPQFPVSVSQWPLAAPDFILTDDAHNLSARELYRHSQIVNQITIRDSSGDSGQDMTEYVADEADPLKGTLYVYPRPWRPIALAHTGHAAVGLAPLGMKLLQKKQLVEFKAGRATVSHPVNSISQVKWQYADLGAVSFSGAELASADAAYSLAWVTFNTRCYAFSVQDTIPETIQFLVMEQS